MSYLNLDLDYFSHPKTMRLVGLLGKDSAVLPIRLWCYCGKHHSESGQLAGYSPQEVESVVGWWGKSGEMIEAMIKVGFIVKIDEGYLVNDWLDHQGHLAMFKKRAKEAARKRWGIPDNATSNATSNAKATIKQCPKPNQPNQQKYVGAFAPPTPEEVKIYCFERKNKVDYEKFHNFYASKGWMVGKNKMKDWKAAVRNWEKSSYADEVKKPTTQDPNKRYEETQRYLKSLEVAV